MKAKIDSASPGQLMSDFMKAIKDDPRITTVHISLYFSLIWYWYEREYKNPVSIFSHEIMPQCKISGVATYHRSIRELNEYGYIRYIPSYNHFLRSLVYILILRA